MVSRISNIPQLRVENLLSVMRVVFYKKSITRKEIGEITGLAPTTISQLTSQLISQDILSLHGKENSTGGRQPDYIKFNPEAFYAIGLSIAVSSCHGIISDMYGRELFSFSQDVKNMYSSEELEENIHNLIEQLLLNADSSVRNKILGIGISFPGNVDSSTGYITDSSLLGGKINKKFIDTVKEKFNLPVFMENNVNLCALNESLFGKGKDKLIVLFVFAGFGIGSGHTINGDMFLGSSYSSGNIGHTVVDINGKRCYCGSFGCLESIASFPALFEEFQKQIKLNNVDEYYDLIDGNCSYDKVIKILDTANSGEEISTQIIRNIGTYVGIAIANLLGIINPDLIIFGGDYLKVKDIIVEPIKQSIQSRAMGIVKDTPFFISDYEDMAESHGAASLIIKKFLKNGPTYFIKKTIV